MSKDDTKPAEKQNMGFEIGPQRYIFSGQFFNSYQNQFRGSRGTNKLYNRLIGLNLPPFFLLAFSGAFNRISRHSSADGLRSVVMVTHHHGNYNNCARDHVFFQNTTGISWSRIYFHADSAS